MAAKWVQETAARLRRASGHTCSSALRLGWMALLCASVQGQERPAAELPASSEVPQGAPAAVPTPPVPQGRLRFVPILFAEGQARLLVDSEAILEYIAQALLAEPPRSDIRLEGHSDGVEAAPEGASREARLALSRQRAEAVRDFLVKQGIPGEQLIVVGVGSSSPLGDVRTEQDRQRNRAVVLSLVPKGSSGALRLTTAQMPESALERSAGDGGKGVEAGPSSASGLPSAEAAAPSTRPTDPSVVEPSTAPPTEVIALRERQQLRGPAMVETVQLGVRMLRREGPGSGGRERWPFQEFLQREIPSLEAVIRRGLSQEAGLVGDMRIRMTLQADGRVSEVGLTLPMAHEEFEAELRQYLSGWQMPPPPGRDVMRIELAIAVQATFQPWLEPGRQSGAVR